MSGYGRNGSDIDLSITSLSMSEASKLNGSDIVSLKEVNHDKAQKFIKVVRSGAVQLFTESSQFLFFFYIYSIFICFYIVPLHFYKNIKSYIVSQQLTLQKVTKPSLMI